MAVDYIVATLSIPGISGVNFTLVSNPSGIFGISGSLLIANENPPLGIQYPVTIEARLSDGTAITQTFGIRSATFPPPPPPVPPLTSAVSILPTSVGPSQTATVFFIWNDAVINFTTGAVVVTEGSIGSLTQVDATHFTATFTPSLNTVATGTVQVLQSGMGGAHYSNAAGSTTQASNVASVFVNTTSSPSLGFSIGTNMNGLYQGSGLPPVIPTVQNFQYYTTFGVTHFRIPFSWSITESFAPNATNGVQHTTFAALDTGYLSAMDQTITNAIAAGGLCLLDCHMFMNGPGGFQVGTAQVPTTALADMWGKIAAHYVANPVLLAGIYGLELMNEPPNGFSIVTIITAYNQCVQAIRDAGYDGDIYLDGTNFSSAWNWTSGQGQPFSSDTLTQVVDPLNRLIDTAHMYPDSDDSGQGFGYNQQILIPGTAPPGINTNPDIFVQRVSREFVPWVQANRRLGHIGEYGNSNDTPASGGTLNFAAWDTVTTNGLDYLKSLGIPITLWTACVQNGGFNAGFGGYGYSLDPFNSDLSGALDFTSAGVQAPLIAILKNYLSYSGPEPTAYALIPPGWPTTILYCSVGTPSGQFSIYYGGNLASPVTVTPHASLVDGTSAGGTFTPSSIVLQPGQNPLVTFVYTASQEATLIISTTNNAGWSDPPSVSLSSVSGDPYQALAYNSLARMYGLYNRFTPNTGAALTLQRASDNQQLAWSFTLLGNGFANLDRIAIQSWASARSGISIVALHSIGPNAGDITFSGTTFPTLNLQNAAGYPEIVVPNGVRGEYNISISGASSISAIARMNQSGGGALSRMDWLVGPIIFGLSGNMQIFSTGFSGPPVGQLGPPNQGAINTSLSLSIVNGQYHDYGTSYASGVTNGFQTYKDGSLVAQTTVTYQFATQNNATQIEFCWFKNGTQPYLGSFTNWEISPNLVYASTDHSAIAAWDALYYSTPLPDVLPVTPPLITGALTNLAIYPGTVPARPFGVLSITDSNGGSPTETVTITLSGAAGTLSGTGISGSGPYTIGPDTPANVTANLNGAVFTTAAGLGSTTTFALLVNSSAGSSSSNNSTSTIVSTYSVQSALTPPVGSFTIRNWSGWNFAGGELNPSFGLMPRTYEIDYLAAKGFGLCRLVISSQWLYTTAFGQLNSSYLASIKAFIDYAFTKNVIVIIDPHNGGSIWDAAFSVFRLIVPSSRAQDLFQDFSRRVAAAFINYDDCVVYGLMNEPAGMTAVQWRDGGVTPAITAIRAIGSTQFILIPGAGQSSALGWASNGNTAAFASYAGDPLNNFAFEAHQYLDASASGGSPVATLNGSTILNTFNSFLTANSFKGFLGEFGMCWTDPWYPISAGSNELYDVTQSNPQTTSSVTANSNMLTVVTTSALYQGWAAWGGGPEFAPPKNTNAYFFQMEPQRSPQDGGAIIWEQPQMSALQSFIM